MTPMGAEARAVEKHWFRVSRVRGLCLLSFNNLDKRAHIQIKDSLEKKGRRIHSNVCKAGHFEKFDPEKFLISQGFFGKAAKATLIFTKGQLAWSCPGDFLYLPRVSKENKSSGVVAESAILETHFRNLPFANIFL